jgi:hypothetical protein
VIAGSVVLGLINFSIFADYNKKHIEKVDAFSDQTKEVYETVKSEARQRRLNFEIAKANQNQQANGRQ